eukprot:10456967-Karenia_brevis.AAC.1
MLASRPLGYDQCRMPRRACLSYKDLFALAVLRCDPPFGRPGVNTVILTCSYWHTTRNDADDNHDDEYRDDAYQNNAHDDEYLDDEFHADEYHDDDDVDDMMI